MLEKSARPPAENSGKGRILAWMILVGVVMLILIFVPIGGFTSGQVVDVNSNQPIQGAVVIVFTTARVSNMIHGSSVRCLLMAQQRTDSEGKFFFWPSVGRPGFNLGASFVKKKIIAYKPGYQMSISSPDWINKKVRLYKVTPDPKYPKSRLDYLFKLRSMVLQCSDKSLVPFFDMLRDEARSLTTDVDELKRFGAL